MQQDHTIPQSDEQYTPSFEQPNGDLEPQLPPEKKRHPIRSFLANFGILIAAPLIALLLIAFVFQSYEVDGPSMQNTLQDKDRLVVLKLGKTIASARNKDYIPDRYSIIIFHKGDITELESGDRQLVKRVIALPGERVTVQEGVVTVYNDDHPNGFNPDTKTESTKDIKGPTQGNIDLTVKSGELFVLGDNRNNSSDSRVFGTIDNSSVVGELALRIFPFSSFKSF